MLAPLDVLKFGSSVLQSESDVPAVVHEIYRHVRRGRRVVAVVSAFAGRTDRLLERSRRWTTDAAPDAVAQLLATGEAESAAMTTIALDRAGISACVLPPTPIVRTEGPLLDAAAVALDATLLHAALRDHAVVVVPGFVGRDVDTDQTTLLGRGGSDLTAVFLAGELGADRCVLVKDVDAVHTADPAIDPAALPFDRLTWAKAIDVAGVLVQRKAIEVARERGVSIEVTACAADRVTRIGRGPTRIGTHRPARRPLRVALLGLGAVGLGVYESLRVLPEHFEIAGVLVRERSRPRSSSVREGDLVDDADALLARDADVVVELIGGTGRARDLIERSLRAGRSVVTANKAVLAGAGAALDAIAARHGVRVLGSAAVGGGVPMLERVDDIVRTHGVDRIEGVLNGTTSFVLDAIADGACPTEAVRRAQACGFAEADPSLDLSGADAAQKLAILCRRAFGRVVRSGDIPTVGLDLVDPDTVRADATAGYRHRLVAEAGLTASGVRARVALRSLPVDDALARGSGAANALRIHRRDGQAIVVHGMGAGRWPTTEAVIADLFDLRRASCADRARRVPRIIREAV